MKKTVVIEILLAFIFAVLIACMSKFFEYVMENLRSIEIVNGYADGLDYSVLLNYYNSNVNQALAYAIPTLIAAVANLVAMVLIALRDIPALRDKLAAHKEQRAAAKAEQAETAKQQRISKLEAELNELKKDE